MPSTATIFNRIDDATPPGRDRVVDALRAGSILVVVLWHCCMSVLQWNDRGALSMPNPIDTIPGGWLATWVLQVMPLFFIVGGYGSLTSLRNRPRTIVAFGWDRARRQMNPLIPMVLLWVAVDGISAVARGPLNRSVLEWGLVVFVPLWFIGVYAVVTALAPLTAEMHRRAPGLTLSAMAGLVIAVDIARFTTGIQAVGTVNTLAVFAFAHQLGYHWRDGRFSGRSSLLIAGAVTVLGLMVAVGPYPGSMVATGSTAFSNMNPTTAPIAVVAVLQLGLVISISPLLRRVLQQAAVWKGVVAANMAAMTIFTWHMTALVIFTGIWTGLGLDLAAEPTSGWWAVRPLWIIGPAAVLALLVATVHRIAPRWSGIVVPTMESHPDRGPTAVRPEVTASVGR